LSIARGLQGGINDPTLFPKWLDDNLFEHATFKGKVTEHIVPYLPGFDLDPKDIRFLGTPIDLIAFKGLNASVEEVEIVFVEIKTGRSVLSAREKAVKKAVEEKKVSWRVFNPDVEVDRPRVPVIARSATLIHRCRLAAFAKLRRARRCGAR
jgi:hypothetical protein